MILIPYCGILLECFCICEGFFICSVGHSFKGFLQQHIDQAFLKGFDDNVGRHSSPSFFQVNKFSFFLSLNVSKNNLDCPVCCSTELLCFIGSKIESVARGFQKNV